jgi:hypothetical protein
MHLIVQRNFAFFIISVVDCMNIEHNKCFSCVKLIFFHTLLFINCCQFAM